KDNPDNERFNQTIQTEFINFGNFNTNPDIFNKDLTEWLIEYNFHRPLETLNYETPLDFSKVLPMWSSCTGY
ncbi:MAG: integrase core domain-containing protein, partial [Candidatus Magasanikbacteria bacterium]